MGWQEDEAETYVTDLSDLGVSWNGIPGDYIDITVHHDERPQEMTSIVASVGLTLEEAKIFAERLATEIARCEEDTQEPTEDVTGTVAPSAPVVRKRRYLGNLFRFRAVNHSLFFGVLAAFALSWTGGVGIAIGLILGYGLTMYYYLGVQLACRACASRLHAVRSHGEVLRCHKCGQPTDRAVDMGLGV